MPTPVKLLHSVMWKKKLWKPGEVIVDMDDGEAKRLVARKSAVTQSKTQSTDAPKP